MRTKALRQHVHEKAAEKLVGVERQRLDLAAVAIVLPPKRDGVGGDVDEPVIGNGDAVGVPREVVEDVRRAAKGRLRIDDPGLPIEGPQPRAKGRVGGERREGARDSHATLRQAARSPAISFPRKTCRRTFTGRKKVGRAWIHRVPSGDKPPAGTTQWTWG